MPSITYGLTAVQVPVPVVPSGYLSFSGSSSPDTYHTFVAGDLASGAALALNQDSRRTENFWRLGGGGYGVINGLALSAGSGLTLNIGDGLASINGPVKPTVTTKALTDAVRNYVWMTMAGAISLTLSTDPSPLVPPTTDCCYLGSCLCAAGAISDIDYSGRVFIYKGQSWRKTADVTTPADSPSTEVSFYHETSAGLFFWHGVIGSYVPVDAATWLSKSVAGSSDVTLSATEARNKTIKLTGALTGNISVKMPLIAGLTRTFINATSGAYTITIKATSGTGVLLTQGTQATFICDGTNVILALTDLAVIGAQPLDATLTALAGLATGADKVPYSTGTDAFSQMSFNSDARTLVGAFAHQTAPTSPVLTAPTANETLLQTYIDSIATKIGAAGIW